MNENLGMYMFYIALCMGGAAWFILIWAIKDGQFNSSEDDNRIALDAEEKYI
jgi:cbb3-type cytochrome oxidase maturation protein